MLDAAPSRPARTRMALGPSATVAVVAAVVRVALYLRVPMSPDEGGFLIVGSQWSHGRSLYGNYWVDRPPLLIAFFSLADALGGWQALRVLGVVVVMLSVVAAGWVGRLAAPPTLRRRAEWTGAVVGAVFLSTPLFGVGEVNGELLATALVLAATASYLAGLRTSAGLLLLAAGGLGAAAVLVKQNEIDLVVLLLVGAATTARSVDQPVAPRRSLGLPAAGAAVVTGSVLLGALTRGTTPAGVWQAVVVFRLHATALIASAAPSSDHARLHELLASLAISGAPLVVLAAVPVVRRRPVAGALDLRAVAAALLAWETLAVLLGGSYWLHYLISFVPGLVLASVAVSSAAGRVRRWPLKVVVGYVAVSAVVASATFASPLGRPSVSPAEAWLRVHSHPGEPVVVAFGQANWLAENHLVSPYSELWSLPVRVRDPHLVEFAAVLASPARPCLIVTDRTGLPGWGMDGAAALPVLRARYHLIGVEGDYPIYGADHCATTAAG